MSKVTLNGTTGLTAYKADNTTVEVQYSPAELHSIKPSVFTSASPFIIRGGLKVDSTTYPPSLSYDDGTSTSLINFDAPFVASTSEATSPGDTVHLFPTGIQAGDILVMLQFIRMYTGPGYGPTYADGWGFDFTRATGSQDVTRTRQAHHYYSGGYDITDTFISYKVATGSESGASIGGFQHVDNPFGSDTGWRRLMVFRPNYPVSSIQEYVDIYSTGSITTQYADSHTASVTNTFTESCAKIVVSFHLGYLNVVGPSVTGISGLSNTETYNGPGGIASYVHTGATVAGSLDTSFTLTGQTTISPELLHAYTIKLIP